MKQQIEFIDSKLKPKYDTIENAIKVSEGFRNVMDEKAKKVLCMYEEAVKEFDDTINGNQVIKEHFFE